VIFGHPTGENLKPGTRIRQPDSEYQYIVSGIYLSVILRFILIVNMTLT